MKRPARPGLLLVVLRELRWLRRDRVAGFLLLGVPLIGFAVLAGTFGNAVIRDLGVLVVDADRSDLSLSLVQAIDASAGVRVTGRADDLAAATRAIRSGAAIAAARIPENFERDVIAGRRPRVEVFYNTQFMTPGNVAGKAVHDAIDAAAAALAPSRRAAARPGAFGALVVEQYVTTNPALSYTQFLLRAVLPTVLHVVIAIGTGYAVGSEFGRRSRRAWLRCAGGSPLVALLGKLLPLFGIFALLMVVAMLVLHGGLGVGFRGDALQMGAAALLFILAHQGFGALAPLLARQLSLGLSLIGLVVSPAFGYAGVGFPVIGMEPFAQAWGAALPLRWYLQILFDQAARGVPAALSAEPFAILAAMAIGLTGLAWLRLRQVAAAAGPMAPEAADPPPRAGLGGAFLDEWRRVLGDRSLVGLLILAPVIYGVYYPRPYLGQLVRDVPVVIVDHDRTALSREIVQAVDAHEGTRVALRADSLAEARQAVIARRAFGILEIPAGMTRDALKGDAARLAAYVDATYFILFNRALQGIGEAVGTVAADRQARGTRDDGAAYRAALAAASPVEIGMEPLYNPTGGYGSYAVPAAFVLILQQTLLVGAAMLAGGAVAARGAGGALAALVGRGIAHLTLTAGSVGLLLILLPRVYGFSTLGRPLDLLLITAPFLLATSFMGQAAGTCFRHRETAVVLFIATSLPQFFLVGVSWPAEAIPPLLRSLGRLFPSESAIDGLVRVNQMGARLGEIATDWAVLWALAGLYLALGVLALRLRGSAAVRP